MATRSTNGTSPGATASAASAKPQAASTRVEIIPGELWGRVYVHEIATSAGGVPCWSYVSEGLGTHQHKEIVFTLRRERDEAMGAAPPDPLRLFGTIYRIAGQGQRVIEGGVTELGTNRFFGCHLLYADAQPLDGVDVPSGGLAAVLINDDELRAVRQFGCMRVLGRMGQAVTHYPFPPWNERDHRGLALADTFEHSLLSNIGVRISGHIVATLHDNRITVGVLRALHASWRRELAKLPDAPFVLQTLRDPHANACLVWTPGQSEPTAISPGGSDGSRVTGCCVIVLGEQPHDGGKLFEDGFAVELTNASWAALRRAMIEGNELTIPSTNGGMDFALTWQDTIYGGSVRGRGAPPPEALPTSRFTLEQVRLLTGEAELAERTASRDIAALCVEVRACAERTLGDDCDALEAVVVRFTCTPGSHRFDLAYKGEAPQPLLSAFHDAVKALAPLPVRQGEVAFEAYLKTSPRESKP